VDRNPACPQSIVEAARPGGFTSMQSDCRMDSSFGTVLVQAVEAQFATVKAGTSVSPLQTALLDKDTTLMSL